MYLQSEATGRAELIPNLKGPSCPKTSRCQHKGKHCSQRYYTKSKILFLTVLMATGSIEAIRELGIGKLLLQNWIGGTRAVTQNLYCKLPLV